MGRVDRNARVGENGAERMIESIYYHNIISPRQRKKKENVEGKKTNPTLQHTQPALKHIHDRIIQTLPVIDGFIIVHARDHIHVCVALGMFLLHHTAQKLNVAAREQVEATVDIHDALARLRRHARDERIAGLCARGVHEHGRPAADNAIGIRRIRLYAFQQLSRLELLALRALLRVRVDGGQEDATEIAQVVCLGAQQHAADKVGGRDAGRALDDFEALGGFDDAVAVFAGGVGGDVVTVHNEGAAVLVHPEGVGDVWGARDGEVGPFAGGNGGHAFAEVHDGGAFVVEDFFVRVDADDEVVAELLGLEHCAGMAWGRVNGGQLGGSMGEGGQLRGTVVGKVEAAIDPDAVLAHRDRSPRRVFRQSVGGDGSDGHGV